MPCIPGEGDTEKKIIAHYKKYYGTILKGVKLIPSGIAVALIRAIDPTKLEQVSVWGNGGVV